MNMSSRARARWRAGTLTVALVAAAGATVALVAPANAATGCTVTYTSNDWTTSPGQGGFTASLVVRNLSDPVNGWTLRFAFPGSQLLTQGWSATWSQAGSGVTATNLSWNAGLAAGASTSIGFNGSWTGADPAPNAFSLNGVACTGATTTPTTPTTPTPTTPAPTTPAPTPPTSSSPTASPTQPAGGVAPALHVSGNRIVTASGSPYRLLGVNRSGGEFACIQGNGIWDGPMDQASITAMRTWKVRTVRVPLNEQCWLGVAPVPAQFGGTTYQNAVKSYVNLLIANGITPVLDLHWTYGQYTGPSAGCSDVNATCQKPMPDAQYSPSFWTGVANAFKGNDAVVFDLFNEPYVDRATGNATTAWTCWRDGGTCPGVGYQVAGFQGLVNTVRATGATNIIMIGGLAYSNDLTQWLTFKPTDPLNNLAAFAHVYNFNACANTSCYDSQLGPVAAQVPLSLTEIGENDCAHGFVDPLMTWADSHSVGYIGWTWNTWDCSSGPALISNYDGTPTNFGQGLKTHFAAVSN